MNVPEELAALEGVAEKLIQARDELESVIDLPPAGKDRLHGRISNAHALASEMIWRARLQLRATEKGRR